MGRLVSGSKDNLIKLCDRRTGIAPTTLYVPRIFFLVMQVDTMPVITVTTRIPYKREHGLHMGT